MDIFHGEGLMNFIKAIGLYGTVAVVFAESGLFFGFFLPGDSLLFTAGLLASTEGSFNIFALVVMTFIAAVAGDSVGYAFGKKVGPKLFNRPDSRFFKRDHLLKAKAFYEKHGAKTIVLARFTPFIRTFAPIVAGAGDMHYGTFITYNIIGGFLWSFSMCFAGYFLGSAIPDIDKYILPIIAVIVFVSVLPTIREFIKSRRAPKVKTEELPQK